MHLVCIVGARPNFMKIAPILSALDAYPQIKSTLVHTGQHYDQNLSEVFFRELGIRAPDVSLEVGSGTHARQTADILVAVEQLLTRFEERGDRARRLVVVGDVNSTMAASLAAAKRCVPVAHVEAGLRSGDRSMPEEINRIVTDSLADMLFVTEPSGVENLRREGHANDTIHLVGNVMIDTLQRHIDTAKKRPALGELGVKPNGYAVVTLHRPSNVDRERNLRGLVDVLLRIAGRLPILFPVHPRTQHRLEEFGLREPLAGAPGVHLMPPLPYLDFVCLTSQARAIVTDSGGLQEESTVLGIPCLTMRTTTERPITVEQGTSTLVGEDYPKLEHLLGEVIEGRYKTGRRPDLWDGKAAGRIAAILVREAT